MTPEQFHEWVLAHVASKAHVPTVAPPGVELDLPHNVTRGREWLNDQPSPAEGTASDTLYAQAAWLLDYGLSYDTVLDMLDDHSPGYDRGDIATRVYNATKHRQNEIGAHAGQGMMVAALERWAAAHPEITPAPEREPLDMPVRSWAWARDREFPKAWWWWNDRCVGDDSNLYTGRPKAGKTTLVENLAVAVCGGVPLLGKPTRQGPVFFLIGEDRYGEVKDNVRQIQQALHTEDQTLVANFSMFSIRSDRVHGGHALARIDDNGVVQHSTFFAEVIVPHLKLLPKPCLWIIDPVAVFFNFNRYADAAARALVDGFLNEIVDMGVTPLLTDHPSQASLEDGRNVAGSVQMTAAFPLVATLKADKWQGALSVQRRQTFELMGSRYAPEGDGDCEFYRLKSTPAFSLTGAAGHSRVDQQMRVYQAIMADFNRGVRYSDDKRSKSYGRERLAQHLIMSDEDIHVAVEACLRANWLQHSARDKGDDGANVPRHLVLGDQAPKLAQSTEPEC